MLSPPLKIYIPDLPAMADFARTLAGFLRPGDVVALDGTLGAGKTTLVQLLGQALGVQEKIVSPTFTLIHDYVSGSLPILHADLYRLGPENAESLAEELLSVIQEGRTLVLVEWAQYGAFLDETLTLSLQIARDEAQPGETARVITLQCQQEERLAALQVAFTG